MPELPEIETITLQLTQKVVGRKIVSVDVRLPKLFIGDKKAIIGRTIASVTRRAKMINIGLNDNLNLAIHLKLTGQLVYGEIKNKRSNLPAGEAGIKDKREYVAETVSFHQGIPLAGFELPGKTTHVIFDLNRNGRLFFNDNRQFGWIRVLSNDELSMMNDKLGPEPFADAQGKPSTFTVEYLQKICKSWGRPIKQLLMEQTKVAGIGNIYANEVLWCAGISPLTRAKDLAKDPEKIKKLYLCILKVLKKGIKYQGSSARDETYINALGEKGQMQKYFVVYQKKGATCPRCGGVIKMIRVGGRGTFYCPDCQN